MTPIFRLFFSMRQLVTYDDFGNVGTLVIDDFKNNLTASNRMKGPHGMHPVNDPMWTEKHKEVGKDNNRDTCRSCHGVNGEGTVLARTGADRVLECKEKEIPGCNETSQGKRISLSRGTQVSCALCHDNFIDKD